MNDNERLGQVLELTRERFGGASVRHADDGDFVVVRGDVSDDAQWARIVLLYEELDERGLQGLVPVVMEAA